MTIKVGGHPVRRRLTFAIALGLVVLLLLVITRMPPEASQPAAYSLDADLTRPGTQLGFVASFVALIWMYPGLMSFCFFPTVCVVVLFFGKLFIDDLGDGR